MFTLKAQERVESCGFTYKWTHHLGDDINYVDEEHSIEWIINSTHVFNPQNPQIVRELPVMGRCDCVYQMIESCNVYIQSTDVEVYDESFQYLFTFEDTNLDSYTPGETCYEYPSSGVYYLKIIEYLPWVTEEFGWYKLQVDKYSNIEDIIDVSINNSDICSGDQICVNIENINFYAYYNIYWNNTLIHSGSGDIPQQQYSYCFGPSTLGNGTLRIQILDNCEGEANYYYNVNVRQATDFALPAQVCVNQNVTISASDITWCDYPVQGATYAVNWGDGTTSNGLPASHTYTADGIYNVTLTIYTSQITETIVKQIEVNPLPNNVTITGHQHTCAGTSTYTITDPQEWTTYTWSIVPSNHGTIPAPNMGTTKNITWNTQNFIDSVPALLIIQSNNGCINKDTIKVFKCCTKPGNPYYYDQTITSSLSPGNYYFNGTITFTGNFTNNDVHLKMGPEANIIISPNSQITFNTSAIYAECNHMWNEITVNPNARVTINNSEINHAYRAINSINGGRFVIYNTLFNQNLIGINVQTFSGNHLGTVSKCTFKSTDYNNNPINLIAPYSNRRGETGIKISSVNNIQIGNTTSTSNQNVFKHLDYGVYIENSNVTLYNNSFGPMPQTAGTAIPENGYGVYAINGNVNGNTLNIGSTSTNTVYANNFSDCAIGLYALNNYNMNVYRNTFTSPTQTMKFGIFMMEHGYRTITIANNSFTNPSLMGVWALNIPYATININDNKFYNSVAGTNETQFNIAVSNIVLSKISTVNIEGNYMYNNWTYGVFKTGIAISNLEGFIDLALNRHYPFIFGNTISYSSSIDVTGVSTKRCGIRVENCRNANIEQNTISCASTISNETKASRLTGIYVIASPSTALCKNIVDHRGFGIQFDGNSSGSKIIRNDLTNNYYGYKFVDATIGNQNLNRRPNDNKWIGFAIAQRRAHGTLAASSNWLYRTSITDYRLQNPYDYINVSNLSSSSSNPTFYNDCAYTPGSGGTDMMAGNPNMNTDTQETEYFIDQIENEYYDRFNNAELLSITNQTNSEVAYENDLFSNILLFKSVNEYISSRDYDMAYSVNNSINPVNIIEQNMKTVNDIYLRTWAKGNWNIPATDYFTLIDIALQSPITSGFGVVSAWIMTQRFDNTNDVVENQKANVKIKHNTNIVISPNPAKEQIQIDGIEQISIIAIYDVFGREMLTQLNNEKNSTVISTSSLIKGVYFVCFTNKISGDILVEKIIIQ